MSSIYMTEAEQLEAIKTWWKKYRNPLLITFSLLLLSASAWRYWYAHESTLMQQASNTYEHMMVASSNQDSEQTKVYAQQLINEYADTVYADVAHLTLAKLDVMDTRYKEAEKQLTYVTTHAHMPELQRVAQLRTARLFMAEKAYDRALQTLETMRDPTYLSLVLELKGDIYVATGRYKEAEDAYHQAIRDVQEHEVSNPLLDMKNNKIAQLRAKEHLS